MQLSTEQCHQLALTAHAAADHARRAEHQAKQAEARSRRLLLLTYAVATAHALSGVAAHLHREQSWPRENAQGGQSMRSG